jgi:hypothetical protein
VEGVVDIGGATTGDDTADDCEADGAMDRTSGADDAVDDCEADCAIGSARGSCEGSGTDPKLAYFSPTDMPGASWRRPTSSPRTKSGASSIHSAVTKELSASRAESTISRSRVSSPTSRPAVAAQTLSSFYKNS